jgi:hypothetical protein
VLVFLALTDLLVPVWDDEVLIIEVEEDRLVNMFRILFLMDFRPGGPMQVGMGGRFLRSGSGSQ